MAGEQVKSPGTDNKELLLAKLLQNAWARKLGWCRGTLYEDQYGQSTDIKHAAKCCVLGAASLSPDTDKALDTDFYGWVDGNDSLSDDHWGLNEYEDEDDYEDVGHAFKVAMTIEDPSE